MKIRTVEAKLPDWIFTCAPKSAVNIHDLCKIFKVTDHTINTWINLGLFPPCDFKITKGSWKVEHPHNKREWFVKTIIKFAKQNEAQL